MYEQAAARYYPRIMSPGKYRVISRVKERKDPWSASRFNRRSRSNGSIPAMRFPLVIAERWDPECDRFVSVE